MIDYLGYRQTKENMLLLQVQGVCLEHVRLHFLWKKTKGKSVKKVILFYLKNLANMTWETKRVPFILEWRSKYYKIWK